jgi:hypothetical protein
MLGTYEPGSVGVSFISPADTSRAGACREVVVRGKLSCGDSGRHLFIDSADLLSAN